MLRKDKRSMLLSLIIGDGCLHYVKNSKNKKYGAMTIAHSIKQSDYIAWKAKLIGSILGREIRLRKGTSKRGYKQGSEFIQIQTSWIRFKAWRKFIYPNGQKDKSLILRFINNPEFLISIWLMDDGYVEGKIDPKYNKCYNANLRVFVSDQTEKSCLVMKNWIYEKFGFSIKIKYQKHRGNLYPFFKINSNDSLALWVKIREFVLQFKSMQYKFRFLEMRYQHKLSLAHNTINHSDDIVGTV